jgi:spore coat protein U-like protein
MKLSNQLKYKLSAAVIGCFALGLTCASASAQATATTTFAVTATVQATCAVSATALPFGTYSTTQLDGTSTITVTCTNTTPYNVGLDAGTGASATVSARKMTGPGAATLNYSLFSNTGRTTNWGNTTGTDTVVGAGTGSAQILTVYGRIAAGQYVAPGSFTDTITATVYY